MQVTLCLSNRHRHPFLSSNDDGEPSNSAGMPIYGQIHLSLTNTLVVVARIFGGVKLGVGGLIRL
jgi:putative IMPACT (imprinted ancient) family translation regulator